MNLTPSQFKDKDRFLIREIMAFDNEEIKAIIFQVSEEYKIYDSSSELNLYQTFQGETSKYWVVEDLTTLKIVGGGGYKQLKDSKNIAELQKLFLLPEARGYGLAKATVELILSHAKSSNYKQVYLETANQMKEAIRLYGNFGFKKLEKPMSNLRHSECTLFMIKDL